MEERTRDAIRPARKTDRWGVPVQGDATPETTEVINSEKPDFEVKAGSMVASIELGPNGLSINGQEVMSHEELAKLSVSEPGLREVLRKFLPRLSDELNRNQSQLPGW